MGCFKPQQSKLVIWELDLGEYYNDVKKAHSFADENTMSPIKRFLSGGNILGEIKFL